MGLRGLCSTPLNLPSTTSAYGCGLACAGGGRWGKQGGLACGAPGGPAGRGQPAEAINLYGFGSNCVREHEAPAGCAMRPHPGEDGGGGDGDGHVARGQVLERHLAVGAVGDGGWGWRLGLAVGAGGWSGTWVGLVARQAGRQARVENHHRTTATTHATHQLYFKPLAKHGRPQHNRTQGPCSCGICLPARHVSTGQARVASSPFTKHTIQDEQPELHVFLAGQVYRARGPRGRRIWPCYR